MCGYTDHWMLGHPSAVSFYSQIPQSRSDVTMLQGKRDLKRKEIVKQQGKWRKSLQHFRRVTTGW